MEKGIPVIFIFLLFPWSYPATAARYDREHEGVSPVLFRKKLKEVAHGLWDEMGNEKQRSLMATPSEDNMLALRKGCKAREKLLPPRVNRIRRPCHAKNSRCLSTAASPNGINGVYAFEIDLCDCGGVHLAGVLLLLFICRPARSARSL